MSKRVLILSLNYYPRFIGGAEVAIKEITDRIPKEDIEFHVLTLRFDTHLPKVERMGNVTVHRIGFTLANPSISDLSAFPLKFNKYWFQLFAARYAEKLHRTHHFDIVWAMMAHSCGIPAGLFKKRHPEVKYLLTLQEGDPPEYIERVMRPVSGLFRQGFERADALQAISTFLLAWGKHMGFRGHGVVIPNAVDTKRFAEEATEEKKAEMRERLSIQEGETTLITTSRLVHKNGIDDVIRALTLLPENITFVICGIGPLEASLRNLVHDSHLSSRVRFVGQVEHGELPIALQVSSVFIRPSRSEGMGNSFIEAMAAGTPVIATQEGGISDFLFDEKRNPGTEATGWAVEKDSPEDIAKAVKDILNHPEKVQTITKRARTLVYQKYDWNLVSKQMAEVFNYLLGSR